MRSSTPRTTIWSSAPASRAQSARKGGLAIQEECERIGSIPLGEAAITTGGKLKAKFVIHAASMHLGGLTTEVNLRASTRNALLRAEEHKLESVAFPAIGTGIAGFPLDRCAQVMLGEVRDYLRRGGLGEVGGVRAFRSPRARDLRAGFRFDALKFRERRYSTFNRLTETFD